MSEQPPPLPERAESEKDPNRLGNSYSSVLNIWIRRYEDARGEVAAREEVIEQAIGVLTEQGTLPSTKISKALDLLRESVEIEPEGHSH